MGQNPLSMPLGRGDLHSASGITRLRKSGAVGRQAGKSRRGNPPESAISMEIIAFFSYNKTQCTINRKGRAKGRRRFMATNPPASAGKKAGNTVFLQVLFVVTAFALMVASSAVLVNNMLRNRLKRDTIDMLNQTKLKIETGFIEPQTALLAVSEMIRGMIMRGDSVDDVHAMMKRIGKELKNKQGGFTYNGLHGYFEAFGGIYLSSMEWEMPEDFNSTERPWYKTAIEAGDTIAITPLYKNVRINDYIFTYVRRIFDDEGQALGIVCMNMPIDNIRNYAADMRITEGSYGFITDSAYNIIAHPIPELVGANIADSNSVMLEIAKKITAAPGIYQRETQNQAGVHAVVFAQGLENGWILYMLTPKNEYYQELRNMMWILGILGMVFALALSAILLRVDRARRIADRENRRKSIQLAEMEKVREADERAQFMLDAMPLYVNYFDRSHKNIACTQEAVRLFGAESKQEYLAKFQELSPEYQPCGRPSNEMAAEYAEKAFAEGQSHFEWMHQKLDGEQIPCDVTLVRVQFKGEPTLLGYIRDLRELKTAIREKQEADELTELMLNLSPLGVNLFNGNAKIIECNQEMLNLFDMPTKQDMSDNFFKLSPEYQPCGRLSKEMSAELITKAFEEGYLRFEWMHQKLNGEPVPCEVTLVPIKYRNEYAVAGYTRDLREYKQMMNKLEAALREAQEANAAKSKFLATMSHEIRTPMNVILGITESYLQEEKIAPELRGGFEKIYSAGDLLLHIINDILDLSKIEAGKLELIPVYYDVMSLINDAAHLNVIRFQHKPIQFKLTVDENIPAELYGDELRIKQILNNLLSNALKYTEAGEVALSFDMEKPADINEKNIILVLKISDTGQGMTAEQLERIFDEYTRFNVESNRTTVGTGLGMAITRNLVTLMDGELFIESAPGKGTTVTVRIPQGINASAALGKKTAENLENFILNGPMQTKSVKIKREPMPYGRVLVVDDMKTNLDVAKLLLNPYQLSIDTAESGSEAINMIKNGGEYDIIFMDHMMPIMDGMEATKKIRELGYRLPIFALTANVVPGQQEIFYASGFDGYISKPIDIRQLDGALNKYIRDKNLREGSNQ